MKRKMTIAATALLCFVLLFGGCGQKEMDPEAFYVYYLNIDYTGIVPVEYEMEAKDPEKQIREALAALSSETQSVEYTKTIPSAVKVEDFRMDSGMLSLYFDRNYKELETYTEVMVRAAVVKTLLQIDGISNITFYVADNPLTDSSGQLVGAMDNNSFIDDFGQETESLRSTTLTLYYASADGQSLVREEKEVYYSSNVALERLVIEYLMKKPDIENAQSVFPSNTKLLSVSVTDGVCYVSLDSTFQNQNNNISENVAIYSIVNSLTELDQINKVQITFSGKESQIYPNQNTGGTVLYEKNPSIVIEDNAGDEEEDIYIE